MIKHPQIVNHITDTNLFDEILYRQEGDHILMQVYSGDYSAEIVRQNKPNQRGYKGSLENPTRITSLHITYRDFFVDPNLKPETAMIFCKSGIFLDPKHQYSPEFKKVLENLVTHLN